MFLTYAKQCNTIPSVNLFCVHQSEKINRLNDAYKATNEIREDQVENFVRQCYPNVLNFEIKKADDSDVFEVEAENRELIVKLDYEHEDGDNKALLLGMKNIPNIDEVKNILYYSRLLWSI